MADLAYVYEPPPLHLDPYGQVGWGVPASSSSRGFDLAAFGKAAGQAGVGTYASGAGTVLSFVGSLLAARQAKKTAAYNADVIKRNAAAAANVAEIEAQQHLRQQTILLDDITLVHQAQAEQERQQRLSQDYLAGQTQAIVAGSGLLMRGSPLAVYEANLRESERQVLASRYRADLEERTLRDAALMEGYAAQMARYGAGERLRVGAAQGALARYGGRQQQAATRLGGVGNLASGTARTYATYARQQALRGPTLKTPSASTVSGGSFGF